LPWTQRALAAAAQQQRQPQLRAGGAEPSHCACRAQMFSAAPLKPEDVKFTSRPAMVNDRGY
jgi:hypothetical protein